MTEYIERDMLCRVLERYRKAPKNRYQRGVEDGMELALNAVKAIHTADVAPVVHGRWVYHDDGVITCSECGNAESSDSYYCRYCGAKMDNE